MDESELLKHGLELPAPTFNHRREEGRKGEGESGRRGEGEKGRWGDGEMGRRGVRRQG